MDTIKVLLYYKYVAIKNPEEICDQLKQLCTQLDLKGRILIAHEGINGTVAGSPDSIDEYIAAMAEYKEFSDIEWKVSWTHEQIFPRMRVAVRPEIVTLGLSKGSQDVDLHHKAEYIEPEDLLNLYESGEEFVILDARNAYEATIGKFKDALVPPIDNFREFPNFVQENLTEFKDKPVVTYCTGGIRCEKASAYLRQQGFKDVRQLHGGIHVYSEKTGGKYFEGEMFVFDKRLHVPVNKIDPSVLAECEHCHTRISRYIDCVKRDGCKGLFICCPECETQYDSLCKKCS